MQLLHEFLTNLSIPQLAIPQVFKDLVFDYLLYLVELTFSFDLRQIKAFLFSLLNYLVFHLLLEMFYLINQRCRLNNPVVFIINHQFRFNVFFINYFYSIRFTHFHLLILAVLLSVKFLDYFDHCFARYPFIRTELDFFILNLQFNLLLISLSMNYQQIEIISVPLRYLYFDFKLNLNLIYFYFLAFYYVQELHLLIKLMNSISVVFVRYRLLLFTSLNNQSIFMLFLYFIYSFINFKDQSEVKVKQRLKIILSYI